MAQSLEKLHTVHFRHFDIEDGKIWGAVGQRAERRQAVMICANLIAFSFKENLERRYDVLIIVYQSQCRHRSALCFQTQALPELQDIEAVEPWFECRRKPSEGGLFILIRIFGVDLQ